MHIVLATDGSECSRTAVEFTKRFPWPPTARITLLTVVPKNELTKITRGTIATELRQRAERLLAEETARLQETGWETQTLIREGHVAATILDAAAEFKADLLVVGSHGLSMIKRFLLGSVTQKVLKYGPCSVLIVRSTTSEGPPRPSTAPLRILAAYDGSRQAEGAVKLLASLPLEGRAELSLVTVLVLITAFRMDILQTQSPLWHKYKREEQERLEARASILEKATPAVAVQLREGPDESEALLEAAREASADLVIVGSTGRSAIERFLLGSVSNRVMRYAPCSVLVSRVPR